MLSAIAAAKREILLEMYWVADDAVGRRFRDQLAARALAGVAVLVVYAGRALGAAPDARALRSHLDPREPCRWTA